MMSDVRMINDEWMRNDADGHNWGTYYPGLVWKGWRSPHKPIVTVAHVLLGFYPHAFQMQLNTSTKWSSLLGFSCFSSLCLESLFLPYNLLFYTFIFALLFCYTSSTNFLRFLKLINSICWYTTTGAYCVRVQTACGSAHWQPLHLPQIVSRCLGCQRSSRCYDAPTATRSPGLWAHSCQRQTHLLLLGNLEEVNNNFFLSDLNQ